MINVSRFGLSDNRMHQQLDFRILLQGLHSQFKVSSVHGVSGLESHNLVPSLLLEGLSKLGGSFSDILVVVGRGKLDSSNLTTDVGLVDLTIEVVDSRVL